ncbi:UNVERIFIED_CONTAM: hypothetical protein Sradi_6061500 [Sesamum radiatum]|uniref:Uncharacterized protein n=1 Tax=Sesamum radiatum TaxID=300843 RepID=A0AAW2KJL0_SESRA
MDLLSKAYATASDDDDDNDAGGGSGYSNPYVPPPKRIRPETSMASPIQMPVYRPPSLPTEAPVPGRYISKRQRAALGMEPARTDSNAGDFDPSSGMGSLSDSDVPHGILTTLRRHMKGSAVSNQTPQSFSAALNGHVKPVNVVQWSTTHVIILICCAHILLCACFWEIVFADAVVPSN